MCARAIQQAFHAFNLASKEKLEVRIGIDVGEPIADSDDLFGTTVQIAAIGKVMGIREEQVDGKLQRSLEIQITDMGLDTGNG